MQRRRMLIALTLAFSLAISAIPLGKGRVVRAYEDESSILADPTPDPQVTPTDEPTTPPTDPPTPTDTNTPTPTDTNTPTPTPTPEIVAEVSAVYFPDNDFRDYVAEHFDDDNDGKLTREEAEAVTGISLSDKNIVDLSGVEIFPNLERLSCDSNNIQELDLSQNPKLKSLFCDDNQIVELDLSACRSLETVICSRNPLTKLDVSGCIVLEHLSCDDCELETLDLSKNKNLEFLNCDSNALTELKLGKMPKMESLTCMNNKLTSLNLMSMENLEDLDCKQNEILSLNLVNCIKLETVECQNNKLTSLSLGTHDSLYHFYAESNPDLKELDISNCPRLVKLITDVPMEFDSSRNYCLSLNNYTDPDLQYEIRLDFCLDLAPSDDSVVVLIDEEHFPDDVFRDYVSSSFDEDGDGALKVSEIKAATAIVDANAGIEDLTGIEYFTSLTYLMCLGNDITTLDLSKNVLLRQLDCRHCESLTTLDLSKNTELVEFECEGCSLTTLDLRANKKLKYVDCTNVPLESLNVRELTELETLYCPSCSLTELDVTTNVKLENLDCSGNQIAELDLTHNPCLAYLDAFYNQLTSIDTSKNPYLWNLRVSDNQLTSIDISNNTYLTLLATSGNQISVINIDGCTDLLWLVSTYEFQDDFEYGYKFVEDGSHFAMFIDFDTEVKFFSIAVDEENFPDEAFRAYVSSVIDVNHSGELDLIEIEAVKEIKVSNSKIKDLTGVEIFTFITELDCSYNSLTSLDLSANKALLKVNCSHNKLAELDVSANKVLKELDCRFNNLTLLNVRSLQWLKLLLCSSNKLTELDLSSNMSLVALGCEKNELEELILSGCPKLVDLCKGTSPVYDILNDTMFIGDLAAWEDGYIRYDYSAALSLNKVTPAPVTPDPVTPGPTTPDPVTPDPVTPDPITPDPTTPDPVTPDPTTPDPVTPDPTTPDPTTPDPTSPEPHATTPAPSTPDPTTDPNAPVPPTAAPKNPDPAKDPSFEDFVERLYTVALGRSSETEGKNFWVEQVVKNGFTGADCARFFMLGAPEFLERGLTDDQFVEVLYKTYFDRDSEPDGKAYWLGRLASGTERAVLVEEFIESVEWCNVCATYGVKSGAVYHKATVPSKNAVKFATRLYTCCLGRDPEEDGLQYWALALTNLDATGYQAASLFFTLPEFVGLKTTNEEYLTRLYTTFMGREPEADGFAYWLGLLNGGTSREDVMKAFAGCPEFQEICNQYGIVRGEI